MRIAIASSCLPPAAGIGTFVDDLAKCYQNHNVETKVFVTTIPDLNPKDYDYPVHINKIPVLRKEEYFHIKQFLQAILDFMPDAIVNNDCIYASNILQSLPTGCVRASVVHGYREGFGFDGHPTIIAAAIHNHEWLDWIFAISGYMRDGLIKRYSLPAEQVKLIYNGINPLDISDSELSRKFENSEKIILFGGGSNLTKGWDTFFKACKILTSFHPSGWKIIWVGGNIKPPNVLKKSAMLNGRIEWKGKLPRSELIDLLGRIHILAMPSRAEGCPALLAEGLSMGVVPVVSNCPSAMEEIVNDYKCGIVTKVGNAKELAKGLSELLSSPEILCRMSTRARKTFEKNLHIDITCQKHLELLKTHRSSFSPKPKAFPFGKIYPFHRRGHKYPKWNPLGLIERWRFINGILPKPLKYKKQMKKC